jgi:hypothetical protein
MRNQTERWKLLCEQASVEQDPVKMLELIREINELLEQKRVRLNETKDKNCIAPH